MLRRKIVLMVLLSLCIVPLASAQIARVFLSGTGNDANDCTNQATPCRSLQGAVTACPVNGEIIVLDSGGFGTATINKSLTVNAPAGIVAFNARTINVVTVGTDKVVLRGLTMDGTVFGDTNGILFSGGGTLVVENSTIAGFQNGINQTGGYSSLLVQNCEFRNNSYAGIWVQPGGASPGSAAIENSRFQYNGYGILAAAYAVAVVRDSVASNNTIGFAINTLLTVSTGFMQVERCLVAHNGTGIAADGGMPLVGGPASGNAIVSETTISNNTYATRVSTSGGAIRSFGNNRVYGNTNTPGFGGATLSQT